MPVPDSIFSLPFAEALAFFRAKQNISTERWTEVWKEEHAKAFMVAGAMRDDLLADFRAEVEKAVAGGTSKAEFRKQFDAIVAQHGWAYNGGASWRSDLIWRTNIRTSYQAGRWQQFKAAGTQYLRYRHADGVINPRPQHLAWDGLILPINDPWWETHYPPNGWGCRCRAVVETAPGKDAAPDDGTYQWVDKKTGETHTIPNGIDPGWDYNVGKASEGAHAN